MKNNRQILIISQFCHLPFLRAFCNHVLCFSNCWSQNCHFRGFLRPHFSIFWSQNCHFKVLFATTFLIFWSQNWHFQRLFATTFYIFRFFGHRIAIFRCFLRPLFASFKCLVTKLALLGAFCDRKLRREKKSTVFQQQ